MSEDENEVTTTLDEAKAEFDEVNNDAFAFEGERRCGWELFPASVWSVNQRDFRHFIDNV
jgi:hypothetical protein